MLILTRALVLVAGGEEEYAATMREMYDFGWSGMLGIAWL